MFDALNMGTSPVPGANNNENNSYLQQEKMARLCSGS
jgi:hypothetical protein